MRALVAALVLACGLAGCYREKRLFESAPPASAPDAPRLTSLRPGPGEPMQAGRRAASQATSHEENAYAVSQGKRLFRWYNCNGCHAQGGGGMGVALMDDKWLYGHRPADIYASIVEGRPGGMPSFGGRIPEDQVWQLAAYVRSLSGQLRKDVAPSRADGLAGAPPENERDQEKPLPPSAAASLPKP
jgi:cytochrome c oxidase cbb3-type subunit 3